MKDQRKLILGWDTLELIMLTTKMTIILNKKYGAGGGGEVEYKSSSRKDKRTDPGHSVASVRAAQGSLWNWGMWMCTRVHWENRELRYTPHNGLNCLHRVGDQVMCWEQGTGDDRRFKGKSWQKAGEEWGVWGLVTVIINTMNLVLGPKGADK